MAKTFKGRPLIPGTLEGKALVSKQPFNTTASYFENMFGGNTTTAPCSGSLPPAPRVICVASIPLMFGGFTLTISQVSSSRHGAARTRTEPALMGRLSVCGLPVAPAASDA